MKLHNLNVWNILNKWIVFQYFICWILHSWNVMEWHSGTGAGVQNHILGPWTKNPGLGGRDWPGSMSMCTSPGPTCQGKMPRYGLVGLRRPLAAVPQVLTEPRTKWLHAMMASDWLIQPPASSHQQQDTKHYLQQVFEIPPSPWAALWQFTVVHSARLLAPPSALVAPHIS